MDLLRVRKQGTQPRWRRGLSFYVEKGNDIVHLFGLWTLLIVPDRRRVSQSGNQKLETLSARRKAAENAEESF
jgi:hypothetical protein